MYKVLTIAGSDPIGGAGIQADIKTIEAYKMYAMSAVTALVAENTTGVFGIFEAPPEFVEQQLDSVFTDIRPDAVKIGMISNVEIIKAIAKKLKEYKAEHIVLDPVMVATSGGNLMRDGSVSALCEELFPMAEVITPNIPEAEVLSDMKIASCEDMEKAAEKVNKSGLLIKGGHLSDTADDLLFFNGEKIWIKGEKINNPNTHGTGCTLSSAIACGLAYGKSVPEAVRDAKAYITGALKANLNLGKGSGPLDHMWSYR